jgi:hypothetical protein
MFMDIYRMKVNSLSPIFLATFFSVFGVFFSVASV